MNELFRKIVQAQIALGPYLEHTPTIHSVTLSETLGSFVLLKCEHLHQIGSFKVRGATNALLTLADRARKLGVIAASTGNHGQGIAWAGSRLGISVTVYAPTNVAPVKLAAMRAMGATVVLVDGNSVAVDAEAARQSAERGIPYISGYNDEAVIAGQGTAGLEIVEQCVDLDAVFVSVGGGGLISGIGTAIKALSPQTRIIGCSPANAPSMYESVRAGRIVDIEEHDTISDGTAGGVEAGSITFPICQEVVDEWMLIDEASIRHAMRVLAENERWMVEGSAGVAFAALRQYAKKHSQKRLAAVLCGRNIGLDVFLDAVKLQDSLGSVLNL